MQAPTTQPVPWLSPDRPAWYVAVRRWLRDVAQSRDLGAVVSLTEVKARPWSIVLRVSFERSTAYFKACGWGGHSEAKLLTTLAHTWPEHVPLLLAVDQARAWLLLGDSGRPLREVAGPAAQIEVLKRMLPLYAEMQMSLRGSVDQFLALELPDRRLSRLPELLENLVAGDALRFGRSFQEAEQLRFSVQERVPALARACVELSGSAYSQALDHGDLHTGNILVSGSLATVCDWGDACVTHPFCTMIVTLESALPLASAADWDRVQAQLMAAYLEPWTAWAPRGTLASEIPRALWVAHILRALDFAHMFQGDDEETCRRWKPLIGQRLQRWIDAPLPD